MKFKLRKGFYKDPFFWVVIFVFILTMLVAIYGF
jgi:hypothetical protein